MMGFFVMGKGRVSCADTLGSVSYLRLDKDGNS